MNNHRYNEVIGSARISFSPQTLQKGLALRCELVRDEKNGFRIDAVLKNETATAMSVSDILVPGEIRMTGMEAYDRLFLECRETLGECGIVYREGRHVSNGLVGFTDAAGSRAILFGFEDVTDAFYRFEIASDGGECVLRPVCPLDGLLMEPNESRKISTLRIAASDSLSALLDRYARKIAEHIRPSFVREKMTGWCSWYYYYASETQDDVLENAAQLSRLAGRDGVRVVQIDDGWTLPQEDSRCVWGDWEAGYKFPGGMKKISDDIHSLGFQSGLWLAPFAMTSDSQLYQAHPDWAIGTLTEVKENDAAVYGLDLTHPEVRRFLRETFTRVFDEWGFDYVKIDFLIYATAPGKRYDERMTSAEAYRSGLGIIRECAGDRFVLVCGAPVLQSAGLCDGARIGADVGSRWYFPLETHQWPHGNCSLKPCIKYVASRQWMHNVFFQNDPDCLVLRDRCNGIEDKRFAFYFPGMDVDASGFGLDEEAARMWSGLITMTGTMAVISEKVSGLSPDRSRLLDRFLESATKKSPEVRMADWYGSDQVFVLHSVEGPLQIGLFNISDDEAVVSLSSSRYRLDGWTFREAQSGDAFSGRGPAIEFPPVPPRCARIYTLEPFTGTGQGK